ncbi:imidazoleglycerol-phosphate dehydratase HisB [Thermogutta sp.]|uniref:imidazoleglycerol-phosphate dehydratase HisB n=1 Tax=Thermogutta sp. TaxID=1962930 RepID=UPI00321FF00C
MERTAEITRRTLETNITVRVCLDGQGHGDIETGIGFFDHMLHLLARHSSIDITIRCQGDLHVDQHHSVEDVGLALGQAVAQALGDKSGIRRYGHFTLPMDETLATAAVDLSGRPYLVYNVPISQPFIGQFQSELVREFFQAFANQAGANVHLLLHYGTNSHHIAEATFKAFARALRMAVEPDPRGSGIPSTKGTL